ncbi:MAG: hypothetical protein AB8C84_05530 [Oligoflexales bacterium]
MIRPSHKELSGKLRKAVELLKAGKVMYCDNNKVTREHLELTQLGFDIEDIPALIENFIGEILNGNVQRSYEQANGKYPPTSSFEPQANGKELWPFCWSSNYSNFRGKDMYLKFVLCEDYYLYLSLHEDNKGD